MWEQASSTVSYEKTNGEAAKRGMMTEKLSMTLAIS